MSLLLDDIATDPNSIELKPFLRKPKTPPVLDKLKTEKIAVIGLGYVGLPLATHLAERFRHVVGLDINSERVTALRNGIDRTHEIGSDQLRKSGLRVTENAAEIAGATFFIVTVPTPITKSHQPDLSPLHAACETIAPLLKKGDAVVFESTVYPGVTENVCGPILSQLSGLQAGIDFSLGYSPERINPGDKVNTVDKITKIISADSPKALDRVEAVYRQIVKADLHRAPSIKVAEGAKVLENTQRDVNIALMNELSLICDRVGIDTQDVIDAAATKWNFVPFTPGLVGGHCIGVDPYYLASLAEEVGLHPQVILAGRRINDGMVKHVTSAAIRMLNQSGISASRARVGVFGITFKENVPDIRNSKAVELVHELRNYGTNPMVHDPHCTVQAATHEGIELSLPERMQDLDMLILSCPHAAYTSDPYFLNRLKPDGALLDVRGIYAKQNIGQRKYWSL